MTANGVPTSIGALSVRHRCPLVPGERLVKCLQRVLVDSPNKWSGEHLTCPHLGTRRVAVSLLLMPPLLNHGATGTTAQGGQCPGDADVVAPQPQFDSKEPKSSTFTM